MRRGFLVLFQVHALVRGARPLEVTFLTIYTVASWFVHEEGVSKTS